MPCIPKLSEKDGNPGFFKKFRIPIKPKYRFNWKPKWFHFLKFEPSRRRSSVSSNSGCSFTAKASKRNSLPLKGSSLGDLEADYKSKTSRRVSYQPQFYSLRELNYSDVSEQMKLEGEKTKDPNFKKRARISALFAFNKPKATSPKLANMGFRKSQSGLDGSCLALNSPASKASSSSSLDDLATASFPATPLSISPLLSRSTPLNSEKELPIKPKPTRSKDSRLSKAIDLAKLKEITTKFQCKNTSMMSLLETTQTLKASQPVNLIKNNHFSLDTERNLNEHLARKQLRSIRSFDDMIYNGFVPENPKEPRTLTVTFSITPKLQSDN